LDYDSLINDHVLKRAVARSLEIIGEASKKLPVRFKSKYPDIEWKKLAGTRDIMIHDYFGIDYSIVHNILIDKIPELKARIENILIDIGVSEADKEILF
jgi:uncharacterized protein with HEPN domain